jgi:predicted CopG family antitoxin
MKKLTITVSEDVYKGLYSKIGAGHISHFLDSLARAHVVDSDITEGYKAMSKDENREREALEWSENLIGDIDDETR